MYVVQYVKSKSGMQFKYITDTKDEIYNPVAGSL